MGTSHNLISHGDDNVVLGRLPPEGGFKLYRHKYAEKMDYLKAPVSKAAEAETYLPDLLL